MTPMQHLRFAIRALRRDLAAGELRVLALALMVSVASVTAVGFFTDRVQFAMERQAADVLAADLKVEGGLPLPDEVFAHADRQAVQSSRMISFPSMALGPHDNSQLVSVKAIDRAYPLRGRLELTTPDAPDTLDVQPPESPSRGKIWIDPILLASLDIDVDDPIRLGRLDFSVERLIRYEPDRGMAVMEVGPRVMIGLDDVESAGLLGPGSRAEYAALFAGDAESIASLREQLEADVGSELRIRDIDSGGPELGSALARARQFLGLASIVTVLLAGAAVVLSTRQFAQRQADASAVLRTLGATRADVVTWLLLRLLFIALGSAAVGILVGWLVQNALASALSGWFGTGLPAGGIVPPLIGLLTALVTLLGFGLIPVLRAGHVPITQVLARRYDALAPGTWWVLLAAVIATLLIARVLSGDGLLALIVIGGVIALLAVFAVLGGLIVSAVRQLGGQRFRLALAGLQRRRNSSVLQLAAFATGIMALLLISIVRTDILDTWQAEIAPDAPNVFVLNIQPDQVDDFTARLSKDGIANAETFPMARARLLSINGEAPRSAHEHRRGGRNEYNLSRSDGLPESNDIVAGTWWAPDSRQAELSVEVEFAEEVGLKLGDVMRFDSGGIVAEGTITSLRRVDWNSFAVNFFVVGNDVFFSDLPASHIASVHVPDQFTTTTNAWARSFPGIMALDIGAMIERVQGLMERGSQAVEYVFLFTVLAGVVVLLAAVQASQGERLREVALLRSLGASHRQLRESIIAEFAILGAIAGGLAASFASAVAWALSRWVFELPWTLNPWLWLIAVLGATVCIAAAGYHATRGVLEQSPARVLAR